MSFNSLAAQVRDDALIARIDACTQQESRENPALMPTAYAAAVRSGMTGTVQVLVWPVSLNTEAEYESALIGGNPNPGGDPAVITDAAILGSVQANWPASWPPS